MWQLHNHLTYSALQFLHFHTAKQPLLHGKNMPFAAQNSLFCIGRQQVLTMCGYYPRPQSWLYGQYSHILWLPVGTKVSLPKSSSNFAFKKFSKSAS